MHQITQSEEVVTLLNIQGQCISYDDVRRIETSWADEQMQQATFR